MRSTATILILLCALVAAAFSFLSDDGFSRLTALHRSLEQQQRTNEKLSETVQGLQRAVEGLQADPRIVEKAARSELGMAKPGELVVIFEKKEAGSSAKSR
jgi:cell division protein FtsB